MRRWIAMSGVVVVLAVSPGAARATLIGDTVTGELNFGGGPTNWFDPDNGYVPTGSCQDSNARSVVAHPNAACGEEFRFASPLSTVRADLAASQVSISNQLNSFAQYFSFEIRLSDLDWAVGPGIIIGLQEVSDNFVGGLTASFGPDSLRFNWGGCPSCAPAAQVAHYTIFTIPEPGTFAMLAAGLLGLCLHARRRAQE